MGSIRDENWNKWALEDVEYKEIQAKVGNKTYMFTIPERTINKKYYVDNKYKD